MSDMEKNPLTKHFAVYHLKGGIVIPRYLCPNPQCKKPASNYQSTCLECSPVTPIKKE